LRLLLLSRSCCFIKRLVPHPTDGLAICNHIFTGTPYTVGLSALLMNLLYYLTVAPIFKVVSTLLAFSQS
jgi:hypothetical protein